MRPSWVNAVPAADDIVALGNEVRGAAEREIGKGGAECGHEVLHVRTAAARGMQRVLQQHVGAASSSITLGFQGLPQNSVNQRPTMALFSCSLDMADAPSRCWRPDRRPAATRGGIRGP